MLKRCAVMVVEEEIGDGGILSGVVKKMDDFDFGDVFVILAVLF